MRTTWTKQSTSLIKPKAMESMMNLHCSISHIYNLTSAEIMRQGINTSINNAIIYIICQSLQKCIIFHLSQITRTNKTATQSTNRTTHPKTMPIKFKICPPAHLEISLLFILYPWAMVVLSTLLSPKLLKILNKLFSQFS